MSGHSPVPTIRWTEGGAARSARWRAESGAPPPARVVIATDNSHTADAAHRLACEGTALLWRGDFQNARQLLQAMARRIDHPRSGPRHPAKTDAPAAPSSPGSMSETFHRYRLAQSQRARVLGMLLIPVEADYRIPLRRAPDMREAFTEAWGEEAASTPSVASLRELLGLTGAHEWRKKGVEIPALEARIHPHYGVFSPLRAEYVALVAEALLPRRLQVSSLAFDIGTGTGVLAALLAKRGVARVVATDSDARAIACAAENLARLGYADRVEVLRADMFPEGRAALIVCNPPWLPARPSSPLEQAIFDPEGRMLRAFLKGLAAHLEAQGEGWLILSDLAEHLGLRTRDELLAAIGAAGLKVLRRADMPPRHPRATDERDPLHEARRAELISLWRLGAG